MKPATVFLLVLLAACLGAFLLTALRSAHIFREHSLRGEPIAEGPILYAAYVQVDGKLEGFTSVDDPKAVPGGNGSWNEKRHGKLYTDFLVVTKPSDASWGTLVIPTSCLRSLHVHPGKAEK